jgi:hypothetical protein
VLFGFHYFCFSKKIRRVPAELMINSERAGAGYPHSPQPQGNHPGASFVILIAV